RAEVVLGGYGVDLEGVTTRLGVRFVCPLVHLARVARTDDVDDDEPLVMRRSDTRCAHLPPRVEHARIVDVAEAEPCHRRDELAPRTFALRSLFLRQPFAGGVEKADHHPTPMMALTRSSSLD